MDSAKRTAVKRPKVYRRCSIVTSQSKFHSKHSDSHTEEKSDNSISTPTPPLAKRGWLRKKGGSHGVWQDRWCEVSSPGILCWFASEKDALDSDGFSKAKGRTFLKDVISVATSSSEDDKTCFDVDVKGRTYNWRATSVGGAREWIECISAWAEHAFKGQDSPSNVVVSVTNIPGNSHPRVNQFEMRRFDKSGMLRKQGGLFGKTWQSRWFVLHDDFLSWYMEQGTGSMQQGAAPRGSIGVHEILSINLENSSSTCFDIDIPGRTIKFQANDNNTAKAWVEILEENSKYLADIELMDLTQTDNPSVSQSPDQVVDFSPFLNTPPQETGRFEDDSKVIVDANDIIVKPVKPLPQVIDCVQDLLYDLEKKIEANAISSESKEPTKKGSVPDPISPRSKKSIDRRRQLEDMARESLSLLPSAWNPNAHDESSSEDDSDDESETAADDENDRSLPRPHNLSLNSSSDVAHPRQEDINRTSSPERRRRGSDAAHKAYVESNEETLETKDQFLNKLKDKSAGEMNREFWQNHKMYLFHVTGFVILHVLYVTSFVLKENDIEAD